MWILARLLLGSAVVSGIVLGAGHVTRTVTDQPPGAITAQAPTASGTAGPPHTSPTESPHSSPATGDQAEESERIRGLAAELSRAVANGHASPDGAARFLTEVTGGIRQDIAGGAER